MHHSSLTTDPTAMVRTKSGPTQRRKSVIADGDFVAQLRDSGHFARLDGSEALVGVRLTPISLPVSHPDSPQSLRKRELHHRCEAVQALFYHEALLTQSHVRGFTLRLSEAVEARARVHGKHCLASLHRRVVKELKRALGASLTLPTPFWFSIEEDSKGRLHLHGEIAFDPAHANAKLIRKGLKTAGGRWLTTIMSADGQKTRRGVQFQLRFSSCKPNFRWAGYCVKNVHKARPGWRRLMRSFGSPRGYVVGFEGKAVTASEGLKRAANTAQARAVSGVLHA